MICRRNDEDHDQVIVVKASGFSEGANDGLTRRSGAHQVAGSSVFAVGVATVAFGATGLLDPNLRLNGRFLAGVLRNSLRSSCFFGGE
jgi:hypothetical protein